MDRTLLLGKVRFLEIGQEKTHDAFSIPTSDPFCLAGLRQNAQDKGNAKGSKKEQPAKELSSIKRFFPKIVE